MILGNAQVNSEFRAPMQALPLPVNMAYQQLPHDVITQLKSPVKMVRIMNAHFTSQSISQSINSFICLNGQQPLHETLHTFVEYLIS